MGSLLNTGAVFEKELRWGLVQFLLSGRELKFCGKFYQSSDLALGIGA